MPSLPLPKVNSQPTPRSLRRLSSSQTSAPLVLRLPPSPLSDLSLQPPCLSTIGRFRRRCERSPTFWTCRRRSPGRSRSAVSRSWCTLKPGHSERSLSSCSLCLFAILVIRFILCILLSISHANALMLVTLDSSLTIPGFRHTSLVPSSCDSTRCARVVSK